MKTVLSKARSALVWLLKLPIQVYRYAISPWIPPRCRFIPTCSSYAIEAIETHGPVHGTYLTLRRVGRCHPWCAGGYDPVPPKSSRNPQPPNSV